MTFFHSDTFAGRQATAVAISFLTAAFVAASSVEVSSVVSFDFEQPVFFEPGERVKDHSLVRIDGVFHLYYMTASGQRFEYATSPDLLHWTHHGEILLAGPGGTDAGGIWAPSVVSYPYGPGYYLMYYTGLSRSLAQRTCLAMSHVLYRWGKASEALFIPFHGDTAWISWNENESSSYRDPGFYFENGTCYLVHTAYTKDWRGAIGLAQSADYFQWEDAGPLYVHTDWHALESPFLMKRNGVYHLFFTEETVGGVSHMSSDSLRSGWDIIGRSIIDGGHAAEILGLESGTYLISRHTAYAYPGGAVSTIRFDTLGWKGDVPEVHMTNALEGWTTLRGTAFEHQPVFGNNPRYRGDDTTEVGFEGNSWIGTYEGFAGPLSGTTPGAIQGDTARGAVRSASFTITGRSMRLLVGGGAYPDSCYVALCDAHDGGVLLSETGKNSDLMDERLWDLTPFGGREAYILIVDDCSSPFGHINVDGIEERQTSVGPPHDAGGDNRVPDKGTWNFLREAVASISKGTAPAAPYSIESSPNPGNPETEIVGRAAPGAAVVLTIYDASGRELCSFAARTGGDGRVGFRWNGLDRSGRGLPAGVYFAALKERGRIVAVSKVVLAR